MISVYPVERALPVAPSQDGIYTHTLLPLDQSVPFLRIGQVLVSYSSDSNPLLSRQFDSFVETLSEVIQKLDHVTCHIHLSHSGINDANVAALLQTLDTLAQTRTIILRSLRLSNNPLSVRSLEAIGEFSRTHRLHLVSFEQIRYLSKPDVERFIDAVLQHKVFRHTQKKSEKTRLFPRVFLHVERSADPFSSFLKTHLSSKKRTKVTRIS